VPARGPAAAQHRFAAAPLRLTLTLRLATALRLPAPLWPLRVLLPARLPLLLLRRLARLLLRDEACREQLVAQRTIHDDGTVLIGSGKLLSYATPV
jgi:hypothetical protein